MRPFLTLILLIVTLYTVEAQVQSEHLFKGSASVTVESEYKYLLYSPSNKELAQNGKLPLIIFLHGAGERGDDLSLVKVHGPPKIVETNSEFPFIVLSPQCQKDKWWEAAALDLLIDEVISHHDVDPTRIYLTGLSMGGFGTWDLAILRPDRFAAIAPICGGSLTNSFEAPRQIKDVPTWVFHGAMDQVVPLEASSKIVKALRDAGSDVKYTIYPMAGHDSWTETYSNPKLYEWFLSYSLKDKK